MKTAPPVVPTSFAMNSLLVPFICSLLPTSKYFLFVDLWPFKAYCLRYGSGWEFKTSIPLSTMVTDTYFARATNSPKAAPFQEEQRQLLPGDSCVLLRIILLVGQTPLTGPSRNRQSRCGDFADIGFLYSYKMAGQKVHLWIYLMELTYPGLSLL